MSYEIKEGVNLPINDEKEEKRRRWKYIIFFASLFLLMAILVVVILVLQNNTPAPSYVEYAFSLSPNNLSSTTTLVNRELKLTTSDESYLVEVNFKSTSESNASIGDYETKDYLYDLKDKNPNVLEISFTVYDNNEQKSQKELKEGASASLFIGNKDEKAELAKDKYTLNLSENKKTYVLTYSSEQEIKIYSLNVTLNIRK